LKTKTIMLSDLAEFKNGKFISSKEYSTIGQYDVFGSNGIIAKSDKFLYKQPVVVIGRVGAFCGSVKRTDGPSWTTDNSIVAKPKNGVDFDFLFYKLIQLNLRHYATGSVQPLLTQDTINSINTNILPNDQQKKVGKQLRTIDLKIFSLKQINRNFEQIILSIFKSWFVDFDGQTELEDSELGEIPKGWTIKTLSDVGQIQPGYAFKSKDFQKDGIKIIKIKNIQKSNSVVDISFGNYVSNEIFLKTGKKFYLFSGDILIAMTGAELGKVGIIPKNNKKLLLNQRVGKVVSKYKTLFYFYLNETYIQNQFHSFASSSSAQGNISDKDIEEIKIPLPIDSKKIEDFTKLTTPIFENIIQNLARISHLEIIRNYLLPKLMSGEIKLKN